MGHFLRTILLECVLFMMCAAQAGAQTAGPPPDPQAHPPARRTSGVPRSASPKAAQKKKSSAHKPRSNSKKTAARSVRSRRASPRVRRIRQAFVSSATLKPMALQLLQNRTLAAYAGVEAYARRHSAEDSGSLAWLAAGYAYFLDHQYAKSSEALGHAQTHAGEIGDYVAYYLADSQLQSGRAAEALALLSKFDERFPESLLIRDAHILYAQTLISAGDAKDAIALLERDREPIRADLELTLGRAYQAAGDNTKAAAVFRHLWLGLPLTFEATVAQGEFQKLSSTPGVLLPSFGEEKGRADALFHARRYAEAGDAYRALLSKAAQADRSEIQLALAESLHHSGQNREARRMLDSVEVTSPDVAARRLYDIGEIERASNDDDGFIRTVGEIRQTAPASPWLEQALLYVGNIYLLRRDYDRAIDAYREIEQRFPGGVRAPYGHWKATWLSLRQGRTAEAKLGFEKQIELFPGSPEVPAALYWRARLAEEDGDQVMAWAYYQKISERFRNFYYGPLARARQSRLKVDDPPHYAVLDRIPRISGAEKIADDDPPEDNLRVEKARLLENGGLLDLAIRELKAAAEKDKGSWLPAEIARMYRDADRYDAAVEALKRAVPNYFAVDLSTLPRSYWEALFPRPYWTEVKRFASSNGLDPYLVAALIRQESEFNPNAVSNKNALGLMQLLPRVGKTVAKQEKLRHFSTPQLFTPSINLELGTRYFRQMVDQFGGFEYALAAYNAGDDRVKDWKGAGKYRDVQEFVESIPFTETREYVEAILRNANVYRQLYGTP
ncbi:MAG: transglycosylase SLT domain-containing protein [Acidobacteria bacterium]|nr:transglycosylase SLT domain-containing protein [Acidobacteriota bacterium]